MQKWKDIRTKAGDRRQCDNKQQLLRLKTEARAEVPEAAVPSVGQQR